MPSSSFALGVAAAMLVGCSGYRTAAVTAPPIAPLGASRSDVATVCLYRPTHIGTALTIPVRDDGLLVGVTEAYTYFCWLAEPGRHRVSLGGGTDAEDRVFTLAAGERLQLRHEINIGTDALLVIDAAEAARLLTECRDHEVVEAPADDQPLPSASRVARALAP